MRQEIAQFVHDSYGSIAVSDTDMDVHAENQYRPDDILQFFFQDVIANVVGDFLLFPVGEGMRPGPGNCQPEFRRHLVKGAPVAQEMLAGFGDVLANRRDGFDATHQHFRFDPLAQDGGDFPDNIGVARTQFAGGGVNNLKLFLDTQGKLFFFVGR